MQLYSGVQQLKDENGETGEEDKTVPHNIQYVFISCKDLCNLSCYEFKHFGLQTQSLKDDNLPQATEASQCIYS